MKRRQALQGLAAGAWLAVPSSAAWKEAFAEQFRQDILGHWANERDYTLTIFDAMPAEKVSWQPTPEVRTFGAQAVHLGRGNAAYFRYLEVPGVQAPESPEESLADPAAIRAFLVASYDFVRESLEKVAEQEFLRRDLALFQRRAMHTTVDLFLRSVLHTAHHRGQMVTYLRLNGIKPPDWQFGNQGL